jgi:hypothetical protein
MSTDSELKRELWLPSSTTTSTWNLLDEDSAAMDKLRRARAEGWVR